MLINWLQRKFVTSYSLGIDIGVASVSALLLQCRSGRYRIEKANQGVNLKALAPSLFLGCKTIVSALSSAAIISKVVELKANLKSKEVYQLLDLNLDKYLGLASNYLHFDYTFVDQNAVAIVAARRETVEEQRHAFTQAGLPLKILDVDLLALERVARWQNQAQNNPCAFLNFNRTRLLLCVLAQGKCIYAKADYFLLTEAAREDALLEKITQNLQMFSAISQQHLERVVLFGSSEQEQNLVKKLNNILQIPAELYNPLQGVELAASLQSKKSYLLKNASQFTIGFGLALRGLTHANH